MAVPLRVKGTHADYHSEVTVLVSPLSLHSIQKLSEAKMSKNRIFLLMRAPFVYCCLQSNTGVGRSLNGGKDIYEW